MPDLLTHVLAAYVLATVVSWRVDWFEPRHVPAAMAGAALPDAAKVYLLVGTMEPTLAGVEVSLYALQTVGVASCLALLGAVLVVPAEWRPVADAALGGVWLHVGLDYLVVRVGGVAPPYLFPLTWAQLPAGNLYLSADVWPAAVVGGVSLAVWLYGRRQGRAGNASR